MTQTHFMLYEDSLGGLEMYMSENHPEADTGPTYLYRLVRTIVRRLYQLH